MAINEEARYGLHRALEQVGAEHAATMMHSVPPVGWGDIATRRDLEMLETRIDARFDRLSGEMDHRTADWSRTLIYANLGAVFAAASLAFAAARL